MSGKAIPRLLGPFSRSLWPSPAKRDHRRTGPCSGAPRAWPGADSPPARLHNATRPAVSCFHVGLGRSQSADADSIGRDRRLHHIPCRPSLTGSADSADSAGSVWDRRSGRWQTRMGRVPGADVVDVERAQRRAARRHRVDPDPPMRRPRDRRCVPVRRRRRTLAPGRAALQQVQGVRRRAQHEYPADRRAQRQR
jgi:hypothetical protein